MTRSFLRLATATLLVLGLAACQSSEERAEEHYQSALALLAEGDLERATVEFRNVFQLNGTHVEARRAYAEALRENGMAEQAYGQFLRLVEQRPDDVEGRIALAQMAIDTQNWGEARRHGTRAIEMAPDDPRLAPVVATLDYATALEAEDESARRTAADDAAAALEGDPGNLGLYRILIDSALRDGETDRALEQVAAALELAPDNRDLHNTRLALLAQSEDVEGIETQLTEMIARFPDDRQLITTLLRFYTSRGEIDSAEAFLRDRIAEAPEGGTDLRLALTQFLLQLRSPEAAMAELEQMISDAPDMMIFRLVRAGIRFDSGARDEAIAELQAVLDSGEGSAAERNEARVALARMLAITGNAVGARRLVGEVLEADGTAVEALKLEAQWLIEDDRADEAIALLRTALEEEPNNIDAMTLMARAHQRNGNRELSRDFLSLAYDASGAAPEETLRYVRALVADGLYLPAEEALIASLRIAPRTLSVLSELGQLYIRMEDWARAEHVETTIRGLEGEETAVRTADGLQVARLAAQGRMEDTVTFLEDLASQSGESDVSVEISLVRSLLLSGERDRALARAREAAAAAPDNPGLLLLQASTEAAVGALQDAEASYRGVIALEPRAERAWTELVRTLYAQGRIEDAQATLEEGLETLPEANNLLWAQASFLERAGEFEGAIATYETLYERVPDNPIVVNNLASMLSTYRDDAESLERAYAIARRLRGAELPQFRDTYGWIAFRRGDLDEARPYLESAAEALPTEPLVQFHYGMMLAADGQTEAAIDRLTRALDLAGPEDTRAQFDTARTEIARLEEVLSEEADAPANGQ
jgi:tetratricopeptide (TPR) repeat protein